MIKMHGKRIQTYRRPFCTPKPDADLWMRVDLSLDKKTVENQDWAAGPPGRRAAGPRGRLGPWAAGNWASGPPGRWAVAGRGPRAAEPRACF